MTPFRNSVLLGELESESPPSKDYRIDFENGRLRGLAEHQEAVRQAIRLRLTTDRGAYPIYSAGYGLDKSAMAGLAAPLIYVTVKNEICSTLYKDDRIKNVYGFEFGSDKGYVCAEFIAETEFGDVEGEVAV